MGVAAKVLHQALSGGAVAAGVLFGLTMSTAGASATMTVAAGFAADSTNARLMRLASSMAKTTGAWVAGTGNGGLDTGTIANSTWYHFFQIMNPATGAVDIVFSATATPNAGPTTMPTGYTLFRRIGAGLTNGSAQWVWFMQTGDDFVWSSPIGDVQVFNPGVAAVLRTLSVPPGLKFRTRMVVYVSNEAAVANGATYISDPDQSDATPANQVNAYGILNLNTANSAFYAECVTNISKQIRTRAVASSTNTGLAIGTIGWVDLRGKLS